MSETGENNRIMERLAAAKAAIVAAVQADQAFSYKDAMVRYTEGIEILLSELPRVPSSAQGPLHERVIIIFIF